MGLIELFLIFGVVLAWGAYELVGLRRDKKQEEGKRVAESQENNKG